MPRMGFEPAILVFQRAKYIYIHDLLKRMPKFQAPETQEQ
jgi:hypothetical protein